MQIRALAALLSISGGTAWIVRWFLADWGNPRAQEELRWIGLGLLLIACLFAGLGLLKGSALWLDVVVGGAAAALGWIGYELLLPLGPDASMHLVLGVLGVVAGFVIATGRSGASREPVREPARSEPPRPGRRKAPAGRRSRD